MNIIETHMPLQDNLHFGGSKPAKWYITNKIENPADLRGSRIVLRQSCHQPANTTN